jgi:UDP-glucose 4-epimerase
MTIMITGGTGYIGSHVAASFLEKGGDVLLVDNGSNSDSVEVLTSLQHRYGKDRVHGKRISLERTGALDFLSPVGIDSVVHCAGLKSVEESARNPLDYFQHNVTGLINTLNWCKANRVRNFVFSSSATVYGPSCGSPFSEDAPVGTGLTSPYAITKYQCEQILGTLPEDFNVAILRYFNPVGVHPEGFLTENPRGKPNNLLPILLQAAEHSTPVSVFGSDYATPDGTAVRDYVHVSDLADAHVKALGYVSHGLNLTVNIGTGVGVSVQSFIDTFNRWSKAPVAYSLADRRPGDVASLVASVDKAQQELGWRPTHSVEDAIRHSLKSTNLLKVQP